MQNRVLSKTSPSTNRRLRRSQMTRVAELYYERNLSQSEIARIMGCSNSTVSRLLAEARDTGVVEITIHRSIPKLPGLGEELRETFALRDAIVVQEGGTYEGNLGVVGAAAAELLLGIIQDEMTIGITWGKTLYHMVQALDVVELENVDILQISGALGEGDSEVDGPKLAMQLAEKLGGGYRLMMAPAIVENKDVRDTFIRQPQIQQVFDSAQQADIIIQGAGALEESMSSLIRAGYLTEDDLEKVRAMGAVGHIVAQMIDANGNEIGDFSDRVVAIPLGWMRNVDWSIGISASIRKAPAILGALRANYFNTLVIDEASAYELIRLNKDIPV